MAESSPINGRIAVLALVCLLAPIAFPSGSAAITDLTNAAFTTEIPGSTDTIRRPVMGYDEGDRIGVSWWQESFDRHPFAIRSALTGSWTVKTNDIIGDGTTLEDMEVESLGGTNWAVAGGVTTSSEARIYTSTDDGATWTLSLTVTGTTWAGGLAATNGGALALVYVTTDVPTKVNFRRSTDYGVTWSSAMTINDNVGGAGTPTQTVGNVERADVAMKSANNVAAVFHRRVDASTDEVSLFEVQSTNGGTSWTIPYTEVGGSDFRTLAQYFGSGSGGTTQRFASGHATVVVNPVNDQYVGAIGVHSSVGCSGCTYTMPNHIFLFPGLTTASSVATEFTSPANHPMTSYNEKLDLHVNAGGHITLGVLRGSTPATWTTYAVLAWDSAPAPAAPPSADPGTAIYTFLPPTGQATSSTKQDVSSVLSNQHITVARRDYSVTGQLRADTAEVDFTVPPGVDARTWATSPSFCSARGNEHFGYNYNEDVARELAGNDWGGGNGEIVGYVFRGDADNFAYLGKGLEPTPAIRVFFRIEARVEGVQSIFRAVASFQDHDSYVDQTPDPGDENLERWTDDAKGDGKETGAFRRMVEVQLKEVENDWSIQLYYVDRDAATPVTSRTKIGAAVLQGNPNTPSTYILSVDARADDPYVEVTKGDGSAIGAGAGILRHPLPANFVGNDIHAQWFVGYGADTAFNNDAFTFLDDEDGDASTCIYTLETVAGSGLGTAATGDPGASGPTLDPETGLPLASQDDDPSSTTPPTPGETLLGGFGLSAEQQFLLAFVLMGVFLFLARKKWDMDPETIKAGILILWIAFVWLGLWEKWTLIAAGVVGVAFYGKSLSKTFGG